MVVDGKDQLTCHSKTCLDCWSILQDMMGPVSFKRRLHCGNTSLSVCPTSMPAVASMKLWSMSPSQLLGEVLEEELSWKLEYLTYNLALWGLCNFGVQINFAIFAISKLIPSAVQQNVWHWQIRLAEDQGENPADFPKGLGISTFQHPTKSHVWFVGHFWNPSGSDVGQELQDDASDDLGHHHLGQGLLHARLGSGLGSDLGLHRIPDDRTNRLQGGLRGVSVSVSWVVFGFVEDQKLWWKQLIPSSE